MHSLPLASVNFNELLSEGHLVYRELAQSLPVAVYTCNAKGHLTFYNKAAAALWGYEPVIGSEAWHSSWKMYKTDGTLLPADCNPMAIVLTERKVVDGEEILVEGADGKRRHIQLHPRPVFDDSGVLTGALNMMVDVTDQRQYQQAMMESEARCRSISEEYEKEIERRTTALKKKNEELERSNAELASFSYIASHDLQEPLRKIITFSDMLRMQDRQGYTGTNEYLDRIISSTQRMKQLIEDVLNFSRVSSSELKFVRTDLNEVAGNVLTDFDHRILEKSASVHIEALPAVEAIPLQMRQLFYNLISNALKFSSPEIKPVIRISSRELSEEEKKGHDGLNSKLSYSEIAVSDNGIGFSQEFAEQIFVIFRRLHGKSEYSGTGIGLALCRKIADNHQGKIIADSRKNEGATFRILLPLKMPSDQPGIII